MGRFRRILQCCNAAPGAGGGYGGWEDLLPRVWLRSARSAWSARSSLSVTLDSSHIRQELLGYHRHLGHKTQWSCRIWSMCNAFATHLQCIWSFFAQQQGAEQERGVAWSVASVDLQLSLSCQRGTLPKAVRIFRSFFRSFSQNFPKKL